MLRRTFGLFCFFAVVVQGAVLAQGFRVSGSVEELSSKAAVAYASVALYRVADSSLVGGMVTDDLGGFELFHRETSGVFVVVQFMGYEHFQTPALEGGRNLDLGTISLTPSALLLSEVEVRGKEMTTVIKLDKQVYKADQFDNARGATATEVIRNLPAVAINAEGEITVRGATGFILMINGKPVQGSPAVLLGQLSANAIEDVEIITAPSARYDPDGKAGIINIKTRQRVLDGLYLGANLQWGLPSIEAYDNAEPARRYNGDLLLNYRKGKWELSTGLDYRRDDQSGRRVGYVNTYLDEVLTEFPSYGERSHDRESYSARLSASFAPNEKNTFGASFYAGKRTQYRTADILYDGQQRRYIPRTSFQSPTFYAQAYEQAGRLDDSGELINTLTYFNENLRVRRGDFLIGALDYSWQMHGEASLSAGLLYEKTILGGPTDNLHLSYPGLRDTLQMQQNDNDNPLDGIRFNLDYRKKIGSLGWEAGYQYRFLKHPGEFVYLDRDFSTDTWISNPLFTNRIDLRRDIHAWYSQVGGQWRQLNFTGGLRLEYFDREVRLAVPDERYTLRRFNVFPSLQLQYDLGKDWMARAAYSRRIERTTTFTLTPFPEREHSETLEQGDAELLPEYIDLAEASVSKIIGDHTFSTTLYWRQVANVINRVNTVYNDTILNRIYTNAGTVMAAGLELSATVFPASWWKVYVGGNGYYYQIAGELFGDEIRTGNFIFSVNFNTTFELGKNFSTQLSLNYLSEQVTAQGRDSRFYNPGLSLNKKFGEGKLSMFLQWRNIDMGLLSANEQRITTWRDDFYTTTNYIYEVDVIMVGLSYQFNQSSRKLKLLKSEFGEKEF
jgi:outer membrane receptor protein involved in Fe transport